MHALISRLRYAGVGAAVLLSGCNLEVLTPKGDVGSQEKSLILIALGLMAIVAIPVIAMTLCFIICIPISVALSYSSNFIAILGVTSLFSYFSIVLVGVSAAVMKWRRPDLYRGSPADWRIGGVAILPIVGAGCALVGAFAVFLVLYYHGNLGIKYFTAMWISAIGVLVFGFVWWYLARAVRSSEGLDLGANYRAIPPE